MNIPDVKLIGNQLHTLIAESVSVASGCDLLVLITGETGSGKQLVAETIHKYSQRSKHPFKVIDFAAIDHALMQSEIYGARQGAYTGAINREGLFQSANRGTILLDEFDILTKKDQLQLLRFIETKYIRAVGSNKEKHIDARIIIATKPNLEELLDSGDLRPDLYYRITDCIRINIPSLKERKADILPIFQYYFHCRRKDLLLPEIPIGFNLGEFLAHYDWPGNVRQLRNFAHDIALRIKTQIKILDRNALLTMRNLNSHNLEIVDSCKKGDTFNQEFAETREAKIWQAAVVRKMTDISNIDYRCLCKEICCELISETTAWRDINNLVDQGFLEGIGSGRGRRYKVLYQTEKCNAHNRNASLD